MLCVQSNLPLKSEYVPFDYLNIYCGPALCSLGGELNGGRILFLPWGLSAHPAGARWGRVRVLMSARVLRKGRNWAVLLCLRVVCWGWGKGAQECWLLKSDEVFAGIVNSKKRKLGAKFLHPVRGGKGILNSQIHQNKQTKATTKRTLLHHCSLQRSRKGYCNKVQVNSSHPRPTLHCVFI